MEAADNVVSKVLIIDDGNAETLDQIKMFCAENDLIGVKTHSDNVMAVLKSNVDLGGVLLSESYHDSPTGGIDLNREKGGCAAPVIDARWAALDAIRDQLPE